MYLEPPKLFNEFIINRPIIEKLKQYNQYNLMNILFYGPLGSGKRTLVQAFLHNIYNVTDLKTYIKEYTIKINNTEINIICLQSMYHYEINLYEYGLYDRDVLTEFVKSFISTRNVLNNGFKIIFLNNFDKITKSCQLAIRALIEKNMNTARFLVSTNSLPKIDKAVVSRFSCMRVPFPNNNTIIKYINSLGITKNISKILKNIDNNLYNLEVCINHKNYKHPINVFIKKIDDILHKSSLIFIDDLRKILHKLHLLNFSPYLTIKEYIKLCVKSKEYSMEELHQITSKAATISISEPYNKYFFSLEDFFILIKTILFKKQV